MNNEPLLPPGVTRAICDKLYDRRKNAALEVEGLVKNLAAQGNTYRIRLIIDRLIEDYAFSPQANFRKGGLLALAAAAVALADHNQEYLSDVVPAVLNSLVDQDARVRYYALEALFNIAKVTREDFMPFFDDTFDALFRLCADTDSAVHQATVFLDNLMKDIATASPRLNLETFVPMLRNCLAVADARKRMFLINWVTVLATVPDIDMLPYLPQLLEGLLDALKTEWREVRTAASKALQDFLVQIPGADQRADYDSLATILCKRANSAEDAQQIRLICIRWLRQFVVQAKPQLMGRYADILGAVLPSLSHSNPEIAAEAIAANKVLLDPPEGWQPADTLRVLKVISQELGSEQEATRLAALHWMTTLLTHSRATIMESLDMLLPALLDALNSPSEKVVVEALMVQASIAEDEDRFRQLMQFLLDRFRGPAGARLLSRRGSLVVQKLAGLLGGEKVFSALAASLEHESDLQFAASMVQALNLILLTAPEVRQVRQLLAGEGDSKRGALLFEALYQSWSHSASATLSICFLAQAYEHASDLIGVFREVRMGMETLVQIDRLVQILETPVFTFMRLHLLQPAQYPALLRSLYGLLMLLPQSAAFKTLHARLHSVPTLALLQLEQSGGAGKGGRFSGKRVDAQPSSSFNQHLDYEALLATFRRRQEEHVEAEERRKGNIDIGFHKVQNIAAWAVAGTAAYYLWVKPQQEAERQRKEDLIRRREWAKAKGFEEVDRTRPTPDAQVAGLIRGHRLPAKELEGERERQ